MKHYRVRLSEETEQDLIDMPERGHIPPELDRIGITSFRAVNFKPYRAIYEVIRQDVFVHCILDGRRDIPSLLERRLIR